MNNQNETIYVNAREVSDITGISYVTVLKHIKAGILPGMCCGYSGIQHRIELNDMETYAYKMWRLKRCLMYDPYDTLKKREKHFLYKKLPK